jgi:hypothetical protein
MYDFKLTTAKSDTADTARYWAAGAAMVATASRAGDASCCAFSLRALPSAAAEGAGGGPGSPLASASQPKIDGSAASRIKDRWLRSLAHGVERRVCCSGIGRKGIVAASCNNT